jgi:hypothetical protein
MCVSLCKDNEFRPWSVIFTSFQCVVAGIKWGFLAMPIKGRGSVAGWNTTGGDSTDEVVATA